MSMFSDKRNNSMSSDEGGNGSGAVPPATVDRRGWGERVPKQIIIGDKEWPHTLNIGNTPLTPLKLSGEVRAQIKGMGGEDSIWVKFEGRNVTGSHKARAAQAHCEQAKLHGYEEITVGSCGNYGEAIAWFAAQRGLRCTIFLPKENDTERVQERLRACGASIVEVDGGYDEAVKASQSYAARRRGVIYDGNSGGANVVEIGGGKTEVSNFEIDRDAYAAIAREIYAQGRGFRSDLVILVPAGNGTLGAGIYHGFKKLYAESLKSADESSFEVPKIVLCTTYNPLLRAHNLGLRDCPPLQKEDVRVNHLTEAVAGTVALDGKSALQAVWSTGGEVLPFQEDSLTWARGILNDALSEHMDGKVEVLEISAAGLAVLKDNPQFVQQHRRDGIRQKFIIIASGEVD